MFIFSPVANFVLVQEARKHFDKASLVYDHVSSKLKSSDLCIC